MQRIYISNTILNLAKDICTHPGDSCVFNSTQQRFTVYRSGDLLATTTEVTEGALRVMVGQGWLTEVKQERVLGTPPVVEPTPDPVEPPPPADEPVKAKKPKKPKAELGDIEEALEV